MLSTGPAHSCPMDCCGNRQATWHSNARNAHLHTHEDTNIHPQKCINIILIVPLYISKEFRVIHPALSFHPLQCPAVWKSATVQKNAWLSKGLVLEHLWSYMSVHVFYLWCLHVSMRKLRTLVWNCCTDVVVNGTDVSTPSSVLISVKMWSCIQKPARRLLQINCIDNNICPAISG